MPQERKTLHLLFCRQELSSSILLSRSSTTVRLWTATAVLCPCLCLPEIEGHETRGEVQGCGRMWLEEHVQPTKPTPSVVLQAPHSTYRYPGSWGGGWFGWSRAKAKFCEVPRWNCPHALLVQPKDIMPSRRLGRNNSCVQMCPAESSCCILATRHFTVPDKPRDRRHPPLTLSNTQREEFEVEARPQKRASTARRPPRPLHAQAGTSLSSTPFIYSHHPRPLPVPSSLSICLPSSTCILIFFATSLPLPLPTLPYPSRATPFRHNPGVCTTQCSAPWTG